jgi:hypothetical protein
MFFGGNTAKTVLGLACSAAYLRILVATLKSLGGLLGGGRMASGFLIQAWNILLRLRLVICRQLREMEIYLAVGLCTQYFLIQG